MKRELNTKESVRTVTSNQFITACGLEGISLKARNCCILLYHKAKNRYGILWVWNWCERVCRFNGNSTYSCISRSWCSYRWVDARFCKNSRKNNKSWRKYQLFDMCQYTENGSIRFEISKQMTDFFMNLTGNFSTTSFIWFSEDAFTI